MGKIVIRRPGVETTQNDKTIVVKVVEQPIVVNVSALGTPGPQGLRGVQGEVGPRGLTGPRGQKGDPGRDGRNGADGKDGRDGINGLDGLDGKDGKDGRDGRDGKVVTKKGEKFAIMPGPMGMPGPAGLPGAQGEPGVGVAEGGSTGQVLIKKSDDDYDTEWGSAGGGLSQAQILARQL